MRTAGLVVALLLLGLVVAKMLPPLPELRGVAHYLPLHTLLETLSVVIAMLVFAVGWKAYRRRLPGNILLLALAFLAVGIFDCMHMLSYAGMPGFLTPNSPEKAIDFWLAGRTVAAIALLAVSITRWRPFTAFSHPYGGLLLVLALTVGTCWFLLFHGEQLPRTFIPGQGLTDFKVRYEYTLVALNLITALVLLVRMRGPLPFNAPMLFSVACTMALSEFFFTLYSDVTDVYNLLGHIYKAVSYLFLYRAVFVEVVEHPYSLLESTKHQLQFLTDHVPIFIAQCDRDRRYRFVNAPYAALFGLRQEDIVGKTARQVMGEAAYAVASPHMDIALSGRPVAYDQVIGTPLIGPRTLLTRYVPEHDAAGNVSGFIAAISDISERKQAEEAMTRTKDLLQSIIEHVPMRIFWKDKALRYLGANALFARDAGHADATGIVGKTDYDMAWQEQADLYRSDDRAVMDSGEAKLDFEEPQTTPDGRSIWLSTSKVPMRDTDGRIIGVLGIYQDITERKLVEKRIESLAHYDQLTGLPNRVLLNDRFKYAFSLAQRKNEPLAVMFMDLDHFKNVNDTLGHSVGDQLLIMVADRIKHNLREGDTVSRLGGDEFVLVLPGTHEDGAVHVATKLLEVISEPCRINHHELVVTPSIGIAIYPDDGDDFETLSKNADAAMYRVKQGGRNNFCFYTPEMQAHSARALKLANALRYALDKNELELYYQPQIAIESGRVIGAEALLRWRHPELGDISPAEFIPIAEDGGQIIPIGEWVMHTAARQLKKWQEGGLAGLVVAVNLSAVQFRQANISDRVTRILGEAGLPHDCLELELTEAVAMDDPLAAIEVMDKLHERGIRMAIDDFGTGYSSLSYLKKFKVAKLKIDQSFVRDITEDPEDKAIVSAIINMAASLGMKTIAEGVETASQLAFLRKQGCDEVQGYHFSRPLPASAFEAYLKATNDERGTG